MVATTMVFAGNALPRSLRGSCASSSRGATSALARPGPKVVIGARRAGSCSIVCRSGRDPASRVNAASVSLGNYGADEGSDGSSRLLKTVVTGVAEAGAAWGNDELTNEDEASTKPLKINRDLMLYNARLARRKAKLASSTRARNEMARQAEVLFKRVLGMDPTDGRGYVGLGKLYEQTGRRAEAMAVYESGCDATFGENAFIWQAWANLQAKTGNVAKARKLFDAATVSDEKHVAAWHGWGMLEKREGNLQRARDLWVKGTKLAAPGKPCAYLYQSLAVLAVDMGRFEEAREWFQLGSNAPQGYRSPALWQAWAALEAREGNVARARALYERGRKACPRNRFIWLSWGVWEWEQGEVERAREILKRGNSMNRRDPALLQAWARLEAEQGREEEARRLFRRAARVDPKHQPVFQAWGVMEYRLGNLDEARELFQKGVWADPNHRNVARVFQAWGVLEREARETKLARELFKCAVKADPTSAPSWLAWAQLEEDAGSTTRAEELRSYCMQSRLEEVLPSNVDLSPAAALNQEAEEGVLGPILQQIGRWFRTSSGGSKQRKQRAVPRKLKNLPEETGSRD